MSFHLLAIGAFCREIDCFGTIRELTSLGAEGERKQVLTLMPQPPGNTPLTSGGAAMICFFARGILVLALLWCSVGLSPRGGFAQTNGSHASLPQFHLPISLEWSESLDPRAPNKLATEGFKFQGGTRNLKMKFSTQAPGILGGKQFQWMPGGYQLFEFSLSRKWGSIQGFRSLRYNARIVRPDNARAVTGAGVEVPKSLLGTCLSAYFLHAAPTTEARLSQSNTLAGSAGSQFGLTLTRELKKGARLQAEWTQTQHKFRSSSAIKSGGSLGGARRGLMMRFEGVLARTDLNSTFIARDEGLANPAAPAYGPGKRNLRLDARRKLKGHQFQYSAQSDVQKASPFRGFPMDDLREHVASWSYASKRLPQFSASQTWLWQTVAGRQEEETGLRLSVARSVRKVNASMTLLHAQRTVAHSSSPLWQRTVLTGDATIEIRKGRQLHARYETSTMQLPTIRQEVAVSSLRLDTRVNMWGEKLSLAPALDIRRQGGSLPALGRTAARLGLSAQIKVPRWIPGTDFARSISPLTTSDRQDARIGTVRT